MTGFQINLFQIELLLSDIDFFKACPVFIIKKVQKARWENVEK